MHALLDSEHLLELIEELLQPNKFGRAKEIEIVSACEGFLFHADFRFNAGGLNPNLTALE